MPADADPMAAYLTYLADVRGGAVGDMGFHSGRFQNLDRWPSEETVIPHCGNDETRTQVMDKLV
jgi:hypothetical protein